MNKSVQRKTVRDVMTHVPKTVGPRTDLRALKAMFQTYEFNAFPVVDEHQVLLGLVSKFDLLRMFRLDASRRIPDVRALFAEHVEDIMSRGVVPVRPDDPISAVIDEIVGSKLRTHLAVQHELGGAQLRDRGGELPEADTQPGRWKGSRTSVEAMGTYGESTP